MNHQLTEVSFAKLNLEGKDDLVQFHLKHEMLTANRTKVILQNENQEPLAYRRQLH
jgi:hypothetical protein